MSDSLSETDDLFADDDAEETVSDFASSGVVASTGGPVMVVDAVVPTLPKKKYQYTSKFITSDSEDEEIKVVNPASHVIPLRRRQRINTGSQAYNCLFSGDLNKGFIPGKRILMAGEHGTGKSTMMLELAVSMAYAAKMHPNDPSMGAKVIYVSNEMDLDSVCIKLDELGLRDMLEACGDYFKMISCDSVEKFLEEMDNNPELSSMIPVPPDEVGLTDFIPTKELAVMFDSGSCMSAVDDWGRTVSPPLARAFQLVGKKLSNFSVHRFVTIIVLSHMGSSKTAKGGTLIPHLFDVKFDLLKSRDRETGTMLLRLKIDKNRGGPNGEFSYSLSGTGVKWDDFGELDLEVFTPRERTNVINIADFR